MADAISHSTFRFPSLSFAKERTRDIQCPIERDNERQGETLFRYRVAW